MGLLGEGVGSRYAQCYKYLTRFLLKTLNTSVTISLVYWGLTPPQQPGSYQGGEMMMMKSVFWLRSLYEVVTKSSVTKSTYIGKWW